MNLANGFYLPILKARGIGTAVNTDGIEWERGKWGGLAQKTFLAGAHATARFADVVVSDSLEIGRIWRERFSTESVYIPYGAEVPTSVRSDRLGRLGLNSGSYALVVARVTPENNCELLLDAVERTPETPLVFVGSANYPTPIEDRLRILHDRGDIQWLGHVDDQDLLAELWANAGVYLHGHSVGGTNPSLLQALGFGAPTLALDTPFNREVVRHEEQLFPADSSVLSERISDIMSSPEKRAEWRTRGRTTVSERYDWDVICDQYLDALQSARERRHQTASGDLS